MGNSYSQDGQVEQAFEVVGDKATTNNDVSEHSSADTGQLSGKAALNVAETKKNRLRANRANYRQFITALKEDEANDFELQKRTLGLITVELALSFVALAIVESADLDPEMNFSIFDWRFHRAFIPMVLALALSVLIPFIDRGSAHKHSMLHKFRIVLNICLVVYGYFLGSLPTSPFEDFDELTVLHFLMAVYKGEFAAIYAWNMIKEARSRLIEQRDYAELAAGYDSFAAPASESDDTTVDEETTNDSFEETVHADASTSSTADVPVEKKKTPRGEYADPSFTVTLPSACCAGLVLCETNDIDRFHFESVVFVEVTVPNSEAERKVLPGDEVVAINGACVYGMTLEEVYGMLFKACEESSVSVELRHNEQLARRCEGTEEEEEESDCESEDSDSDSEDSESDHHVSDSRKSV